MANGESDGTLTCPKAPNPSEGLNAEKADPDALEEGAAGAGVGEGDAGGEGEGEASAPAEPPKKKRGRPPKNASS